MWSSKAIVRVSRGVRCRSTWARPYIVARPSLVREPAARCGASKDRIRSGEIATSWSASQRSFSALPEMDHFEVPPRLIICFGSQTGTAQMMAEDLRDHAAREGQTAEVVNMKEVDGPTLVKRCTSEGQVLTFFVANFGRGEPTDNARELYYWFMAQEPGKGDLEWDKLQFAVFGLGKSDAYPENYQRVGKTLEQKLRELGAQEVYDRGEGDSAAGGDIDEDLARWEKGFWEMMAKLPPPVPQVTSKPKIGAPPIKIEDHIPQVQSLSAHFADITEQSAKVSTAPVPVAATVDHPYFSPVLLNEVITPSHSPRTVHHLKLDGGAGRLPYTTGDYLAVLPQNDPELVNSLIKRMKFQNKQEMDQWGGLELNEVVRRYCDVLSVPRRAFLSKLSPFACDMRERDTLNFLGAPTDVGKSAYNATIVERRLSFLELLQQYPSISMAPEQFLSLCPAIHPAYYSISSSSFMQPNAIDLTVGLVRFKTPTGRIHVGQASGFLTQRCVVGTRVPTYVYPSEFRMPADPSMSIILIAAGSGIAPFRGFILERAALREAGIETGPTILYYGSSTPDTNDLYKEEFEALAKAGPESGPGSIILNKTYSDWTAGPKLFPQDLIKRDSDYIVQQVQSARMSIYVCGHGLLGAGVRTVLKDAIIRMEHTNMEGAEKKLSEWTNTGRFNEDIFT